MTQSFIDTGHRLIAILRGITGGEVPAAVETLIGAGFRAIEIPLNSPDPFASIAVAVETAERLAPGACRIGAGTVLIPDDVDRVRAAGGNLIVSPNADAAVIGRTVASGMLSFPGVFTATEAHLALGAGASGLKFFPASLLGPDGIKAIAATFSGSPPLYAVGGIGPEEFGPFLKVGVTGFGLGSGLYAPGRTPSEIGAHAHAAVDALAAALSPP